MCTSNAVIAPAGTETDYRLSKAIFDFEGALQHLDMGVDDASMGLGEGLEETTEELFQRVQENRERWHEARRFLEDLLEHTFAVGGGRARLAEMAEAAGELLHQLGHLLGEAAHEGSGPTKATLAQS